MLPATLPLPTALPLCRPTCHCAQLGVSLAEATDVANAVLDGVDGMLLGAETLRGSYPVETVDTVMKLAGAAEQHFDYRCACKVPAWLALSAGLLPSPPGALPSMPPGALPGVQP